MSLESYLRNTANLAIIGQSEKDSITRSISFMQQKLQSYFGNEIAEQKLFGSYTRGTILPRYMDIKSDIDYMVVFRDGNYRPQTYLDKLKRFVESTYSRSDIKQSHPTIQLNLNHIYFELVPATRNFFSGLQIPDNSQNQGWMSTDPNGFNQTLTTTNQANSNLIKPLVRVIKYWNAKAGYPYESYILEQKIVGHSYSFIPKNLSSYFCEFMSNGLELSWLAPQWKRDKIERVRTVVSQARQYQKSGDEMLATSRIKQIIPA